MPIFFVWFLLELLAFVAVAKIVGWGWAILLILLGSVAGTVLMRLSNLELLRAMRRRMFTGGGEPPDEEMQRVPVYIIAGMLLFIPGFITDAIALVCLLPPARRFMLRFFMRRAMFRMPHGMPGMRNRRKADKRDDPHVIEGEWRETDDK